MISMLAMAAMVSCTNEIETLDQPKVNENEPVEIKMNAGIGDITTKAPIQQSMKFDALVVASATTNNYETALWTGDNGNISVNNGTVTFDPVQFYPGDGSTIHMKGVYPRGTIKTGVINQTITGDEDIMITSEISASKTDKDSKTLDFKHLLTQLQIKVKATDNEAIASWGTITSIKIKDVATSLDLKLNDGTISENATPNKTDLEIKGFTTAQELTTAAASAGYIMVLPNTTAYVLEIVTSLKTTPTNVTISPETTEASKAHEITLTFNAAQIDATATVGEWTIVAGGSGSVDY